MLEMLFCLGIRYLPILSYMYYAPKKRHLTFRLSGQSVTSLRDRAILGSEKDLAFQLESPTIGK